MDRPHFRGHPAFLEIAAAEIGHPEAAGPAARIAALAAMANLCAQAIDADGSHVPAILARAEEFREQLRAALVAAELMLEFVRAARGLIPRRPGREPGDTAAVGRPAPGRRRPQAAPGPGHGPTAG